MPLADNTSQAFHDWEKRLRGWDVYPYTVELESPLIPLFAYFKPPTPAIDDGRQETFLSELSSSITGLFKKKEQVTQVESDVDFEFDDQPEYFIIPDEDFCTFQISLPTDYTGSLTTYQNFLQSLRYAGKPLSFEVIGSVDQIVVQLSCWKRDSEKLLGQVRAHLLTATVTENRDVINGDTFSDQTLVIDFGLEHKVMYPLAQIRDLKHDPLTALIGSMEELIKGEQCIFQVLFKHTNASWEHHLRESVIDLDGKSLFIDAPEMVAMAREKTSSPLYACVMRICVIADSEDRRWALAKNIGGALAQYDSAAVNNLMPLNNEGYDQYDHWRDVVERTSHRSGMLLSLDELVGFLHYPDEVVKSAKLLRQRLKTKVVPELAIGNELVLGINEHKGISKEVSLSPEQRSRHMYIVGASGTGKSTLLLNCIKQDMESGQGICVLDPHGDLIDQALCLVPESRINDVILLDPSDEEFPIGLNILHAHTSLEKTLLSSDLVAIFERLSTSWGDQMNAVLANGILAFLESTKGGTLVDLRRFLVEKDFRYEFLKTVTDKEIVYYWEKEYPLLKGNPQASVLTRLNTFLRPKPIRRMVAQQKSAIDFADVMDSGKILLVKLSHGGIGEENAYLLGALIASKIHQTALSRQSISQEKRRHFWLYIDEFQNFITPSIAQTLSGARKYALGMVLGHQELTQVAIQDRAIAASVIANPYTRICFRMGDRDAKTLSEGFSEFDFKDLQSLGIGEAIGRIEQAKYDFSLKTYPLPEVDASVAQHKSRAIRDMSRAKYATPLDEVETELDQSFDQDKKANDIPVSQDKSKTQSQSQSDESKYQVSPDRKGKGGERHKEMQGLLQKAAHKKGFGAVIEQHIGDGQHVDVMLNTSKEKTACEISVSTSVEHEVGNIHKCAQYFQTIWMICDDNSHLERIQNALPTNLTSSVHFYTTQDALEAIKSMSVEKTDSVIRGFAVESDWKVPEADEKNRREMVFSRIVRR